MWRSLKKAVRNRSTSRKSEGPQDEATSAVAPDRSKGSGLYSLSNKKSGEDDTDAEPFEVDIVAIHGLNGDAYETWTHHRSQKLWLRDMLPQDMPGARVYTYSYPSQLLFSRSTATISDYAMKLLAYLNSIRASRERRPIVFVAHDLGGIVLKQALLLAQIDPNYLSILESTIGILFFATPHRGVRGILDLGILLGNALDVGLRASGARVLTGKTTRKDLLSNLSANSEILRNISTSFRHLLGRFAIFTFYETEETRPMGRLIVDQDSAMMGVQGEKLIGIFANHTDMCRFDSKDNADYVVIVSAIQQLCREVCHDPSLRGSGKAAVRMLNNVDVNEYRSSLPKRIDGTCQWILHTPECHS
ncbi:hypothetical protein N7G274_005843 [Stereocaulon virgatum]|uniref:DUF676 domain-containing protein n=1 Tax=Stereocaulon virgatum TaxID=373712 RepID=A0ABR4A976_9LECA